MNQSGKIALGIVTAIPIILAGIIVSSTIGMVLEMVETIPEHGDVAPMMLFGDMFYLVGLTTITGLLAFALMIYYIIHAINNKNLDKNLQVIWILILIFASGIGTIIYWYLNIWKDPKPKPETPQFN